ncbi:MAG TPA: group II truncated hemoglobin [Polyangiales bacterium]
MTDARPGFIPLPVLAHPSVASTPGAEHDAAANPHFVRLGGEPTIARLVERFYHHMSTLPEARIIRAMHPSDLEETKRVLTRYLVQWTGGPAHYSAERGHPRLRRRHLPFSIGDAERDAWLACMHAALDETVDDATLREQLYARLREVADFMRNRSDVENGR